MNKAIVLLIMCLPLLVMAQTSNENQTEGGIKWISGLSWEQVKQKAKQENKYIFLDCYATWCGPCKAMDKSVYVNDSVGALFNKKFISVKVQMDKTDKDNEEVKSWYSAAAAISEQYVTQGYPSFVFFSPDGEAVHVEAGFRKPKQFIDIAVKALEPGKVFENPKEKYLKLIEEYKSGIKDYSQFPYMITWAGVGGNNDLAKKLGRELNDHLLSLPRSERYTQDLLRFWINYSIGSDTRTFKFFLEDVDIIDSVQGEKGYADGVIDRTIQEEVAIPFMQEQAKGTGVDITGMIPNGPGFKADKREADWSKLKKLISEKFGKKYAQRSILTARINWYARFHNQKSLTRYTLQKWEQFPFDVSKHFGDINEVSWRSFLYITDRQLLRACLKWMEKAIVFEGDRSELCDTYAQLLYKLGQKEKAIQWENKAVKINPNESSTREALEQMKKNQPTYLNEGANWIGYKDLDWNGVIFKRFLFVADLKNNKPLKGVSIHSDRSTAIKETDGGHCVVETSLGDILTISAKGYKTQKIKITKDPTRIVVILERTR